MHPVDEMLAVIESVQNRAIQESDAEWQTIAKLDAEIHEAATQGFPDVPLRDCASFGFCRIPISRTISETEPGLAIHLMTAPGYGEASSQWRQAMAILRRCSEPAEKTTDPSAKNIFRKEGDTWTLRFNGGDTVRGIKDMVGFEDLRLLLSQPKVGVPLLNFPSNVKRMGPSTLNGSQAAEESLSEIGEIGVSVATDEDTETIDAVIKEALHRKDASDSTLEEKETAESDLAELQEYRGKLKGTHGARNLPATVVIKRNTQMQRFTRVKAAIEKHCPEMFAHLHTALQEDHVAKLWTYDPDEKMEWNKEKTRR